MPQMSPMSWLTIFILLLFYMIIIFNSFKSYNTIMMKTPKIKKTENKMKW